MRRIDRLQLLLSKGYFPEELPPPFHTSDISKYARVLSRQWPATEKSPNTRYQRYSFPRIGEARRNLAIVNPVSQFYLCRYIADNWTGIRSHLKKSRFSIVLPEILQNAERAIAATDFPLLQEKKLEISAFNDKILASDISRFYPTLYTHVIPWALHDKNWCKANLFTPPYKATLGAKLDDLVRSTQENQTLGIPIGPDTSRILSEIVAVSIEEKFIEYLGQKDAAAVRHVDDFNFGASDIAAAASIRFALEKALDYFELQINVEKTMVHTSSTFIDASWPSELSEFKFGSTSRQQLNCIHQYFHRVFELAAINVSDNVLNYGVKRTRGVRVHKDNWGIYEIYLLKAARSNATCIPTVVQILVDYNWRGFPIKKDLVRKFVFDSIVKHAEIGQHGELSWALFLAKALKIQLPKTVLSSIYDVNCSACILLSLDLESRGLIDGRIDKVKWNSLLTSDNLYSEMWLLAYEADLKGWLTPSDANFVSSHAKFKELKARRISFYDVKKNVPSIKKQQRDYFQKLAANLLVIAGRYSV